MSLPRHISVQFDRCCRDLESFICSSVFLACGDWCFVDWSSSGFTWLAPLSDRSCGVELQRVKTALASVPGFCISDLYLWTALSAGILFLGIQWQGDWVHNVSVGMPHRKSVFCELLNDWLRLTSRSTQLSVRLFSISRSIIELLKKTDIYEMVHDWFCWKHSIKVNLKKAN